MPSQNRLVTLLYIMLHICIIVRKVMILLRPIVIFLNRLLPAYATYLCHDPVCNSLRDPLPAARWGPCIMAAPRCRSQHWPHLVQPATLLPQNAIYILVRLLLLVKGCQEGAVAAV